jgi:hypothetical protein
MVSVNHARKLLFFIGISVIMLSVVLDSTFATDPVEVPEPNILALMGVGGAAVLLISLFKRPRK